MRGNRVDTLLKELVQAKEQVASMLHDTRYKETDHLGFMSLFFANRQVVHVESLEILVPRRDALLVTRSMIEGMCLLFWAAESEERALRWRAFACISDWRLMTTKLTNGIPVSRDDRDRIEAGVRD